MATSRATAVIRNAGSAGTNPTRTPGSGPGSSGSTPPAPAPSPPAGYQSVLFWLAWDGGTFTTIPWKAVTQVDLFSLTTCTSAVNSECSSPSSIDTAFNSVNQVNLPQFVSSAHQHNRKAIITIGGSTNPNWAYPCSPADVTAFAQNLVNYMRSNGFDGIDLDIEQDVGTGGFTAAELKACTQDVYDDAKAVKTATGAVPLVTSDVDPTTSFDIGQIENPYIDQFNAMSYDATGSELATWITNLENNSGIPASKITAGIDVTGTHDCAGTASYAAKGGFAGAMIWFGQADASANYACLNAIAPYVSP